MKHLPSQNLNPAARGVALLLTLGMLVLLSGIVVAFLSSVRTDLVSSKSYEGSTSARLLADSAVNLVISQIREASTQRNQAWISQPGLIRTFSEQGAATKAYKLYSATSMIVDGAFDPAENATAASGDLPASAPLDSPQHWSRKGALWTDMNAPIMDRNANPARGIYPIFDGNDLKKDPASNAAIIDADGDGKPDVEGFRIETATLEDAATMPVRWLYMLKDGTLVPTAETGDSAEAKLVIPAGKEKDANGDPNPVVARIAFWTDDETSKVNINTASEGTFWDTPICNSQPGVPQPWSTYTSRAETMFEWDLAERLGAQKEFQRYPGHPATTSLSPILWTPLAQANKLNPTLPADRAKLLELIYLLSPRVTGYQGPVPPASINNLTNPSMNMSSQGGMRRAGPQGAVTDTGFKLTPDSDRLYAMMDELMFDPLRTENKFGNATGSSNSAAARRVLETSKFFLTAHSRAPEQNLWNRPRVAIWPIHASTAKRTIFDQLIAFCSTVGRGADAKTFYFTRSDPKSATADVSGTNARNLKIYEYLQEMMKQSVPGWSGSGARNLAAKHGPDADQILTEILDYIRCTNLVDASDYRKSYTDLGYTLTGNPPTVPLGTNVTSTSRGQVVPIELANGTRGMGRIATISELALVVISKGRPSGAAADAGKTRLEFSLIPQYFSPMAGYSAMANDLRVSFSNVNFQVKDQAGKLLPNPFAVLPAGAAKLPDMYDRRISNIRNHDSKVGGHIGYRSLIENATEGDVKNMFNSTGSPPDSVPPSGEIDVDYKSDSQTASVASKLTISGSCTVTISAPAASGQPVQTFNFTFPQTIVPLPNRVTSEIAVYTGGWRRGGRIPAVSSAFTPFDASRSSTSTSYDVVRSVLAAHGTKTIQGDMRLVAVKKNPSVYFGTVPAYANSPNFPGIHSFRSSWEHVTNGSTFGSLVSTIPASAYSANTRPPIPEGVNGVLNYLGKPGDWDNGPGCYALDGALANKADEGTDRHQHAMGYDGGTATSVVYAEAAPYIGSWYVGEDAVMQYGSFFSPNRQIPSPAMFGSLPTGAMRDQPWQTLLFRPAKPYFPGDVDHPGSGRNGPPDHTLLDLFWMPVVEPYAISEPFATAGKINLNYQMAPFTHIKRDTGLRAVLKSTKIAALNPTQTTSDGRTFAQTYKIGGTLGASRGLGNETTHAGGRGVVVRRDIDLDNTLKQIEDRFKAGSGGNKPFVSASEICDIPLIPKNIVPVSGLPMTAHVTTGFTASTPLSSFDTLLKNFWDRHKLTGDNTLERPYAHIYPRLTTKSNTYTVHVRVQSLKKVPGGDPLIVKEGRDQVTGEFRGSFIVERYLDANSASFVDQTGKTTTESDPDAALGPYRFRVVSSKQFVP